MDRGVLDRMTPAFEHLLRNCVDEFHLVEDGRLVPFDGDLDEVMAVSDRIADSLSTTSARSL